MPESNSNHCLYGYSKTKLPLKVYFRFNMLVHMLLKLIFYQKLVSDLEDPSNTNFRGCKGARSINRGGMEVMVITVSNMLL